MPRPIALCVEDVAAPADARYVRCVAAVGKTPGLGLDAEGVVVWETQRSLACELFATADDRLGLMRPNDAPCVTVHRAGRSLQVPAGKPVILLDQDQVQIGSKRLRIHVHGQTSAVHPPALLGRSTLGRAAAIAATAVALGAAIAACHRTSSESADASGIEVRDEPPKVAGPPLPDSGDAGADAGQDAEASDGAATDAGDADDATDAGDASDARSEGGKDAGKRPAADGGKRAPSTKPPRIEVRDFPPYVD